MTRPPPTDFPDLTDADFEPGPGEVKTPYGPRPRVGYAESFRDRPDGSDDVSDDWLDTYTANTLDGRPVPPRAWHVPDMIPGRTVTLLSGDGGTGKSTLALQLGVATVAEVPWIGQDARAGRVLYLSAEDDADELHRRLDAITVHHQLSFERLAGLRIWPLADQDALLATGAPGKPLEATSLFYDVEAVAKTWRPALIVLDSLADFFGGNENDRAHVRRFISLLRQLAITVDAAVLLLAHPSLTGLATGSGLSGSTAWNNSVRSRLYFSSPKDDDGGASAPDIRTLAMRKANYGPTGAEYRLRYSVGAFVNEDATGAMPGLDKQVSADRIDAQFLDMLDAYTVQGRIVSDSTGRNYAPHLFANDPRAKGTTRKGFEAAMNRLFASRVIRIEEVGKGSHARRKIARDRDA